MALNSSGPMSIGGTVVGQSINLELKLLSTADSSIGQANFRALAKVLSGQISLSDFYGKSSEIVVPPITTNTLNYVLDPSKVPGYVEGETAVEMTIDAGVFIYSDSSLPALTVTGFVAGDTVKIVNNGAIMGKGGKGGYYAGPTRGEGGPGYPSISLGFSVTIQNNGYILGGGGGGSGPIGVNRPVNNYPGCGGGGGGAGGGDGGEVYTYFAPYPLAPFGAGGAPGQRGQNAPPPEAGYVKLLPGALPDYLIQGAGAGGGRVLPGYPGAEGGAGGPAGRVDGTGLTVIPPYAQGGGAGGGGGGFVIDAFQFNSLAYGTGGTGGSNGNPGQTGFTQGGTIGQTTPATGGGGGWGASGGACFSGLAGGVGGKAIALNGYTATVTGTFGIIYGAIS